MISEFVQTSNICSRSKIFSQEGSKKRLVISKKPEARYPVNDYSSASSSSQQQLVLILEDWNSTFINHSVKKIMTTTELSQTKNSALTTQQLNLLNVASATVSTPLTGNTPSPICSTSLVTFNSGYQPLQEYINLANQCSQPIPMLSPITNIFEGVPIFLLPQSSSSSSINGSSYYNPYQRSIIETKANVCPRNQSPKLDTSKNFHVFVGDLANEVDNCTLKAAFEGFGEISEAKVIRDPQTLKSRGYGFVSFLLKENAEKAIEEMNGQMIGRRQIRTNWAVRKFDGGEENATKSTLTYENIFNATHAANTSVYVGGIAPATTDEELMQLFSTIATVIEVRLFKHQGYAFIRYLSKKAAAQAIMSMNGKEINGQKIRCSWSRIATDNKIIISNQTTGSMNLLANNIMGFSPLINPIPWNQNQLLPQFCGHPLLFNRYSYK
ncbi:Nucleolysin TIAR [Dirofilaria immitis]